jgi:hypothetical protein
MNLITNHAALAGTPVPNLGVDTSGAPVLLKYNFAGAKAGCVYRVDKGMTAATKQKLMRFGKPLVLIRGLTVCYCQLAAVRMLATCKRLPMCDPLAAGPGLGCSPVRNTFTGSRQRLLDTRQPIWILTNRIVLELTCRKIHALLRSEANCGLSRAFAAGPLFLTIGRGTGSPDPTIKRLIEYDK